MKAEPRFKLLSTQSLYYPFKRHFYLRKNAKLQVYKEKEKEKINERRKEELKRAEKKDKDKQAIDEYEKWLVGIVC